jgi:hypothetical protein
LRLKEKQLKVKSIAKPESKAFCDATIDSSKVFEWKKTLASTPSETQSLMGIQTKEEKRAQREPTIYAFRKLPTVTQETILQLTWRN